MMFIIFTVACNKKNLTKNDFREKRLIYTGKYHVERPKKSETNGAKSSIVFDNPDIDKNYNE